ncbi:MAG: dTDP-4-dehydrorhamnose reductase [Aquificae bacterium]|nr:dTDP-4-dehydrorhamnose reductase [Aquificota bacterium]
MRYLIVGKNGQLGREFVRILQKTDADFVALGHKELDIGNIHQTLSIFEEIKPQVIINCAAYNLVDKAETDYSTAYRTNAVGIKNLAYASRIHKAFIVHYSTDYIFDGKKEEGLYTEEDTPVPINEYAKSKYVGEIYLQEETDNYLLFRVSWVFGDGEQNFIYKLLKWAEQNPYLKISYDEISVPTYTEVIAGLTLKAIDQKLTGLYHLTNTGYCSRFELAKFVFNTLGIDKFIYPVSAESFNLPAQRPKFSAMDNSKLSKALNVKIPTWEESVEKFLKNYRT